MKSAAGHGRLLWHRRNIASALRDPRCEERLKEQLRLVLEVRRFAFDRMGLRRTRDFSAYTPVRGAVTYVVSACPPTSLTPYEWWFPILGKVPYKGYFRQEDAVREMRGLEAEGFDARVGEVAAYRTPLWIPDPLPSTALEYPPGLLAQLLIHELAHGTVWFKDRVDFDEAAANFIGQEGAADFLAERFGADSLQLSEYRKWLRGEAAFAAVMGQIRGRLESLYRGPVSEADKLARRQEVFAWGLARFEEIGQRPGEPLNNAVILAHGLYNRDLDAFAALHERNGRDWRRTIGALKAADRKDPFAVLHGPGARPSSGQD